MWLRAIASAFPARSYSQAEVWDILSRAPVMKEIGDRGRKILEKVLCGDSGVERRQFALAPEELFGLGAQGLNEAFEREAPELGVRALEVAMERGGVEPLDLDAMIVCTCTGYLCPGLSSHLAERAGLDERVFLQDLSGLGCGAAIPALHAAWCYLVAHPGALVAVVAVEVCSAAFFLGDDPGVLISACLFGDGASATIWSGCRDGWGWRMGNFHSLHRPRERERIRFVNDGGFLRNKLDREVPRIAAEAVGELFGKVAGKVDGVVAHPGGRDVIEALEERIGFYLEDSRGVLAEHGNMSSPSVLVALERRLARCGGERVLWLTAFGAGFAAHGCTMERFE